MQQQKAPNAQRILDERSRSQNDLENDLRIAKKIQSAMVPQSLPAIEGLEMASFYRPSGAVGGDLFDVIQVSEDVIVFVIFDVAGHGMSAALISAMAKVSFSNHIRAVSSPRVVMERVNAEMIRNISTDYYLTGVVAYLDMHDNKLTYCNAGHAYPIIYVQKSGTLVPLCSTGVFIGVCEKVFYEEASVYLSPGDWLWMFTDGIYRVFKGENELVNRKLLEKEVLKLMAKGSPQSVVNDIREKIDLETFSNEEIDDDITAIVVEFLTQSRKSQIKEKLGFKCDDPVYLQFISYFEDMDKAAAIILGTMDSLGYPDENIRKMKIILTELFANAIYHGNKADHAKKVTIGHVVNKKKAVISIMDEGCGFDPKTIPDPTLPENLIKDCGRGLFIVHNYVDKVEFNDRGNRITVVKYRNVK